MDLKEYLEAKRHYYAQESMKWEKKYSDICKLAREGMATMRLLNDRSYADKQMKFNKARAAYIVELLSEYESLDNGISTSCKK